MSRAGLAALEKRVAALARAVPYAPVPVACVRMINLCGAALPDDVQDAMAQAVIDAHNGPACPEGCLCDVINGRFTCGRFWPWLFIELYCGPDGHLTAWSKLGLFVSNYVVEGGIRTAHTVTHPITGQVMAANGEAVPDGWPGVI